MESTAPEIWEQTGGRIDGFICSVGSGGTLAGVAEGLRARKPDVRIGLADPYGAALWHYYAHGSLKAEGDSITEGIGQGRITANLEGLRVDMPYRISDARGGGDGLRSPARGGALPRRLLGHQRRGRGAGWRATSGRGMSS